MSKASAYNTVRKACLFAFYNSSGGFMSIFFVYWLRVRSASFRATACRCAVWRRSPLSARRRLSPEVAPLVSISCYLGISGMKPTFLPPPAYTAHHPDMRQRLLLRLFV
eukprot:359546-Pleurochrysis_carterae.AAC.1